MAIEVRDGVEGKACSRCKEWRPLGRYSKQRRSADGLQGQCRNCPARICAKCGVAASECRDFGGGLDQEFGGHHAYCRSCMARLAREKYYDTPSQVRKREKRRLLGLRGDRGTLDPYEWKLLLAVYGARCLVSGCGREDIEKDHVRPLDPDGSNEVWNRQPLCETHNSSKGNRHDTDYRPDKGEAAWAIFELGLSSSGEAVKLKEAYTQEVEGRIRGAQKAGLDPLPTLRRMLPITRWVEVAPQVRRLHKLVRPARNPHRTADDPPLSDAAFDS